MEKFSETILCWYDSYGRDLPWRRTRDPYAVWLSEIILQQTRIAQGTAYWERFMARFPDVRSLAAATEDEVLRLWEGLGYYSRARNLHAAARQIAALGGFPDTLEGIRSLKGIGDYTAAAIGSIAFGLRAAVVDGNVYRVLSRHFGIDTPIGTTAAARQFSALAQSLLPPDRAGDFNQGMMDFGAMQCTPRNPACLTCPLAGTCQALESGRVESLPVKKAGPAVTERHFTYIYLRCDGKTAFHRRGSGDIWQGLWEPLLLEHDGAMPPEWPVWTAEGTLTLLRRGVKHVLTHRILHTDFYLFDTEKRPPLPEGFRWMKESELDTYAKPRLVELLLEEFLNSAEKSVPFNAKP